MSLPPDYVPWCQAHGLNAWHPDEWSSAGLDAFMRWKRAHYRAKWDRYHAHGYMGGCYQAPPFGLGAYYRARIREDVEKALAPPPSRPFRHCPCHMSAGAGQGDLREPEARVTPAEVAAWIGADPFSRAGLMPRTAACLAWLEQSFGAHVRAT